MGGGGDGRAGLQSSKHQENDSVLTFVNHNGFFKSEISPSQMLGEITSSFQL